MWCLLRERRCPRCCKIFPEEAPDKQGDVKSENASRMQDAQEREKSLKLSIDSVMNTNFVRGGFQKSEREKMADKLAAMQKP